MQWVFIIYVRDGVMARIKIIFTCMMILFFSVASNVSAQDINKDSLDGSRAVALKGNNILFKHRSQGKGLEGKTIVIDPGHGGSDTGAIGPTNIQEKDVTLAISLELRKLLQNNTAQVIMTRQTDKDVYGMFASDTAELQSRVDVANNADADLFISIHVDSFVNSLAGGTTTYYSAKTDQDAQLAHFVEDSLVEQLKLQNRGYQEKNFYVLSNSNMPAILTEVAFISNPDEEKRLKNSTFIKKAAFGIFKGIEKYFNC